MSPRAELAENPLWFQNAVFYELSVRAFHDDNNDGIGDFAGLISKLEYLEWLGVDCIWLLPFQQSPLRDGGYDISDYRTVLADYGTVEDVALDEREARVRQGVAQELAAARGKVVVRDDLVATREQPIDEIAADEAGAARHEGLHFSPAGFSKPTDSSTMNLGRRFVSSYVRPT